MEGTGRDVSEVWMARICGAAEEVELDMMAMLHVRAEGADVEEIGRAHV